MKVTVLSGSPKGKNSVSLQSMNFLMKKFPDHEYDVFHVGQNINKIISDSESFDAIVKSVEASELVLWVSPVYVCLVPAQFKRFIETLFERGAAPAFKGKYTATINSSISFFDNCAVNYLKSVCGDLGMHFAGSFSADSYELLKEEGQARLALFGEVLLEDVETRVPCAPASRPLETTETIYTPGELSQTLDTEGKKILVIKDSAYSDTNLDAMVTRYTTNFNAELDVVNLEELEIKGDCTGCVQCGFDHKCIYEGKDAFIEFFKTTVNHADILIFAGKTKDRWLSSKWKQFFDRSFFQNHTPSLKNKQLGMIVSGPVSQMPTLRDVIEGFTEWQGANLVDIVSDESGDSSVIDRRIDALAERSLRLSRKGYVRPETFLGVGSKKVFRDDIWGRHRFVFQADHKYYEDNGLYDFPHDDAFAMETNKNMLKLTEDPEMREAIRKMLKKEMVKPLIKVVEKA